MGTTPISSLAIQVQNRLEEIPTGQPGIFWNLSNEIYTALIEACSDLLVLVGRPDFSVAQPFTLTANTPWQQMNKGTLLITDIQGPSSPLWRVSLFDLDYVTASWSPSWESDTASIPLRWAPIGLGGQFIVHPAPSSPIQVTITSIPYITTDTFPYSGSETVPFHDEWFVALEEYASHYLRIKECGSEFKESMALYQSYLTLAQRMTQIEDRKDPLVFSKVFGGVIGLNPIPKR